MISVIKVKVLPPGQNPPSDVTYIGRRYGGWPESPLGNPFPLARDHTEAQRDAVIAKYRTWLEEQWHRAGPAKAELLRLAEVARAGDLTLGCWCHPKPCHGDFLKEAIMAINRQP